MVWLKTMTTVQLNSLRNAFPLQAVFVCAAAETYEFSFCFLLRKAVTIWKKKLF